MRFDPKSPQAVSVRLPNSKTRRYMADEDEAMAYAVMFGYRGKVSWTCRLRFGYLIGGNKRP